MFFVYGAYNSKACDKAEFLLYSMGLDYRLYIFGRDYTMNQLSKMIPGVNSVPQIFHGTKYIGGVRELYDYVNSERVIYAAKNESRTAKRIFGASDEGSADSGNVHQD